MVDLFLNLNTSAKRYIKIGDTYGPQMRPYNALGQGDPFSLLAANLYVHTLFTVLRKRTPNEPSACVPVAAGCCTSPPSKTL